MARRRRRRATSSGSETKKKAYVVYPVELRLRVIREVIERGHSCRQVAKVFGLNTTTVKEWVLRYRADGVDGLVPFASGRKASTRTLEGDPRRQAVIDAKRAEPQAGTRRVRDVLARFEGLGVAEATVRRVLHEEGLIDAARAQQDRGPALVASDAAIPYRTTVSAVERYDAEHVAQVLARDFAEHGPPLVLRLDRARAHDAPAVRAILEDHGVLVLHGPPRLPRYYGQTERQNAEHRAWLDADALPEPDELDMLLDDMRDALNASWPRRSLNWATPEAMWNRRRHLHIDRAALRRGVDRRAAHLASKLAPKALRLGTHHRLAIEHELASLGLLNLQPGGWC